jgi:hypothetical protein
MALSVSKRIMPFLIVLFFMYTGMAFSQCKETLNLKQSHSIHGIKNGIDYYYQNLIIQDIAIAGQEKFQDIILRFDFELNYTLDHCHPGLIEINAFPLKLQCRPVLYRGYDISSSLRPANAELVFHLVHDNGIVIDSVTFYKIDIDDHSTLYQTISVRRNDISSLHASYARARFNFSLTSYEDFRDHILNIDNYYAASLVADSIAFWTQQGFLSENAGSLELLLRQAELERVLRYIRPGNFDSLFIAPENDLAKLKEKYNALLILNNRFKAIIGYNHLAVTRPGYPYVKNELLNNYFGYFDHFYQMTYRTNFRFASFINGLSKPEFSNSSLVSLKKILDHFPGAPRNAVYLASGLLVNGLIERGKAFELDGNQLRAASYYNSAISLAKLVHAHEYQDFAYRQALRMNEAIAAYYIDFSKKAALKENPSIAAQYFHDARKLYSSGDYGFREPDWLTGHENWLFSFFEQQVPVNLERKNYSKAIAYLKELEYNSQVCAGCQLPPQFHVWMREAREGIYMQLLDKAGRLMEADELPESEQVYRQAVEMRLREGYRIEKSISEARLEVAFNQVHYDDLYDEGLRNYEKKEFVSALYYFNKAEFIGRSGVSRLNPQLFDKRQDAARQVILSLLSDGRLKAWANDFPGTETTLRRINGMLSDYQFADSDSLRIMYIELEESVLRSECVNIFTQYNELMIRVGEAEKIGDYILAYSAADEAVILSMNNLKCRIRDEEAWYQKMRLETLADYQELERQVELLSRKSVPEYIDAYHELRRFYNKHKLLDKGVVFVSLAEMTMKQEEIGFLTDMIDHYIYLKDYEMALRLLIRMNELKAGRREVKVQQVKLGKAMAQRDALMAVGSKPWELLAGYADDNKWFRDFRTSYKKTWLKTSDWNIKSWPVIWRK